MLVTACAGQEVAEKPAAPVEAPLVMAPETRIDAQALAQESRAMLAQAETDIQRARERRALWLKAWEALVLARQAAAEKDSSGTLRHAKRASELAQLGLDQLAYPAVR